MCSGRARGLLKCLEHKFDEEQLEGAGGVQPGEKEARGGPGHSLQLPQRRLQPGGGWLLLPANK